jgi:hypothetical protein
MSRLFRPFMGNGIMNQRNSHCLGESKLKNKTQFQERSSARLVMMVSLAQFVFEHHFTAQKYFNSPDDCLSELLENVSIKICGFSSSVDQHTLQDMKDSFQTRV